MSIQNENTGNMFYKDDAGAGTTEAPIRADGPDTKGDRAATGIEGLDNVLGGGLPCSRLYLVQGYPGTGKTTLALQCLRQGQSLGDSVTGDVDVSYLADNVLLFRYYEFAGEVRKALSVFKRRAGPHEYAIRRLTLGGPEGIGVGEPLNTFQGVLTGVPVYDKTLMAVRDGTGEGTPEGSLREN